jgi:hypothetical protein
METTPMNITHLLNLWRERDRRYARRRTPLTQNEQEAVLAWRLVESVEAGDHPLLRVYMSLWPGQPVT